VTFKRLAFEIAYPVASELEHYRMQQVEILAARAFLESRDF
jgi:hypothetical protein